MSDGMKKYIGVKIVTATPMTREDFEKKSGRNVGGDRHGNGYEVVYDNGYSSWSPKDVFVEAYRPTDGGMTFGLALEAMNKGEKVARLGWNGKGMWLSMKNGYVSLSVDDIASFPECARPAPLSLRIMGVEKVVNFLPTICMKTADNNILVGWLASQTDMLAEDWHIVE